MALRMDNTNKLDAEVNPTLGQKVQTKLDDGASYVPGQSLARDAIDPDARNPHVSDTGRPSATEQIKQGFKPSGDQTVGEKVEQKYDQGMSGAQPNKSATQKVVDAITPGHAATDAGDRHNVNAHTHAHNPHPPAGRAEDHATHTQHAGVHDPAEHRTVGEKIGDKVAQAKDAIKNAV